MRIIVTKNGKVIIKELEDEKNLGIIEDNSNKKRKYRNFSGLKLPCLNKKFPTLKSFYENTKKIEWGANHRTKSVISKRTMDNFFIRDESKINKQELKQAKKIKLSKSKINISQQFLNKYDDLDVTYKDKIKNLTNTLKSNIDKNNEEKIQNEISEQNKIYNTINTNNKLPNKNENFNINKNHILLGDIISKNNLLNLKTQISKDNLGHDDMRLPLDEKNKNSFNLRSKYEDKKATLDILSVILSLPLNPDRTNLIRYYKQKKNISPFYFENLLKYNEGQIYKLNKICQIIFHKKEDEIKESKIIEDKKFNKEKLLRQKANNYMNCANKIINKSNGIINGYSLKQEIYANKKKKIFKEEVKKIKNQYQDRYGVNNFYKENQIKEPNDLSTTDFEETLYNAPKKKNIINSKSSPNIFN